MTWCYTGPQRGGHVGLLPVHYEPCSCEHLEGCLNRLLYLPRTLSQDENVIDVLVQPNTHQPDPRHEWGQGLGEDLWGQGQPEGQCPELVGLS